MKSNFSVVGSIISLAVFVFVLYLLRVNLYSLLEIEQILIKIKLHQ